MEKRTESGIGLFSVVEVVFIVLKLCGVINWSWWWVFSPTWISAGIFLLIFLIGIVIALIQKRSGY